MLKSVDGFLLMYKPFKVCILQVNLNFVCDLIKGNELDVGNIDFELQDEIGDNVLPCLIISNNCSYFCNKISDLDVV